MFGDRCKSHASATCMRVACNDFRSKVEGRRLQRRKATKGEEWSIGNAFRGEVVYEILIFSMRQVVLVLHAHDFANRLGLDELARRDVA